jgi:hypothetical protein
LFVLAPSVSLTLALFSVLCPRRARMVAAPARQVPRVTAPVVQVSKCLASNPPARSRSPFGSFCCCGLLHQATSALPAASMPPLKRALSVVTRLAERRAWRNASFVPRVSFSFDACLPCIMTCILFLLPLMYRPLREQCRAVEPALHRILPTG